MAQKGIDGATGDGDGTLGFLQLLWSLDHALQRLSKRMSARVGITGPQRLALRVIGNGPGISPGELSRALCLHPSTVTGIVQRLERAGLVKRKIAPSDARRSLLTLTEAGRPLARPLAGTVEDAARRALSRCRAEEVESARHVLSSLTEELEANARRHARAPRPRRP